jgi:hypothetical protein
MGSLYAAVQEMAADIVSFEGMITQHPRVPIHALARRALS